jgi:hypothetical protein
MQALVLKVSNMVIVTKQVKAKFIQLPVVVIMVKMPTVVVINKSTMVITIFNIRQ